MHQPWSDDEAFGARSDEDQDYVDMEAVVARIESQLLLDEEFPEEDEASA